MRNTPTDATEVERAPRRAPSVAQPPAVQTRPPAGGKEVSGRGSRGPAPLTSGLCRGRAAMFDPPPKHATKRIQQNAVAICRICPVIQQCQTWVLSRTEHEDPGGVCGGLTEKQRADHRATSSSFKPCPQCGDTKPLTEFYREARNLDGRRTYCKPCDRDIAQANYQKSRS